MITCLVCNLEVLYYTVHTLMSLDVLQWRRACGPHASCARQVDGGRAGGIADRRPTDAVLVEGRPIYLRGAEDHFLVEHRPTHLCAAAVWDGCRGKWGKQQHKPNGAAPHVAGGIEHVCARS